MLGCKDNIFRVRKNAASLKREWLKVLGCKDNIFRVRKNAASLKPCFLVRPKPLTNLSAFERTRPH